MLPNSKGIPSAGVLNWDGWDNVAVSGQCLRYILKMVRDRFMVATEC